VSFGTFRYETGVLRTALRCRLNLWSVPVRAKLQASAASSLFRVVAQRMLVVFDGCFLDRILLDCLTLEVGPIDSRNVVKQYQRTLCNNSEERRSEFWSSFEGRPSDLVLFAFCGLSLLKEPGI
jgi:hypothetical protein